MAGRIPQSFINELIARADLVEIIDHRVGLKKAGRNYTACCPFHNEKTPSFSVNPDKQFYYCFGCGASGNALTFLMEYEGLEFVAAIEDLAAQMALEVPREAYSGEPEPPVKALFPLMEQVARFYQQQLKTNPHAQIAVQYLKNRGLSGEIAKQYGIGYAPEGWQNLSHLAASNSASDLEALQNDLVETGMMIAKENGHAYDRFRNRIMFPIRNRKGQVLGFGGRVIDQGEPKYLNSPETSLFHKGKELYGLYEMRRQLRQVTQIIIVEGYMDVVALAQFGIYNATATLGTATTSEHLQTLFKICSKVVFCFDGDKAGRAAALRAIHHALPLLKDAREIRIMFLPDGEDPDSLVRKIGTDAFNNQVEASTTLFDYLFDHLTSQVNMQTFEGPASLVHLAKPFSQLIADPILAARFLQKLSELCGVSVQQLEQMMPNEKTAQTARQDARPVAKSPSSYRQDQQFAPQKHANSAVTTSSQKPTLPDAEIPLEVEPETIIKNSAYKTGLRRVIALLLQYPDALPAANLAWLSQVNEPGAKVLARVCQMINENETITTAMLIENWRGQPEEPFLSQLAMQELTLQAENITLEVAEIIKRLEKRFLIEKCDYLIEKSKLQPLDEAEKEQLKTLLKTTSLR